jgi:hypothetical protein
LPDCRQGTHESSKPFNVYGKSFQRGHGLTFILFLHDAQETIRVQIKFTFPPREDSLVILSRFEDLGSNTLDPGGDKAAKKSKPNPDALNDEEMDSHST